MSNGAFSIQRAASRALPFDSRDIPTLLPNVRSISEHETNYCWWMYSELVREKMWARLYLTPLLQAEEDRDQVRRYYADKERANQLLGSDEKVYNSERYVPPPYSSSRLHPTNISVSASSALPSPTPPAR